MSLSNLRDYRYSHLRNIAITCFPRPKSKSRPRPHVPQQPAPHLLRGHHIFFRSLEWASQRHFVTFSMTRRNSTPSSNVSSVVGLFVHWGRYFNVDVRQYSCLFQIDALAPIWGPNYCLCIFSILSNAYDEHSYFLFAVAFPDDISREHFSLVVSFPFHCYSLFSCCWIFFW